MDQGPATGAEEEAVFRPSDEVARQTIERELSETLFVEASAGTGKTHSLVARTVNLVAEGVTTLDRIAAITFTEAAASELRHRIREKLEEEAEGNRGRGPPGSLQEGDRRSGPGHDPHSALLRRHVTPRTAARGGPASRIRHH